MIVNRCLLTGEYALTLSALSHVLRDDFIVDCVPSDLQKFTAQLDIFQPDVVLIDRDPDARGLQLRARSVNLRPRPAVVFLASHESCSDGVHCITKTCSPKQLIAAVSAAVQEVRERRARAQRSQHFADAVKTDGMVRLSAREQEVLRGISLGKPMKQVARDLGISPRTVAFHKYRAMHANGLKNNYDLLRFCIKNGVLSMVGNAWSE